MSKTKPSSEAAALEGRSRATLMRAPKALLVIFVT